MKLTITDNTADLTARLAAVQRLSAKTLKVGLPSTAGGSLRFILAIQEHGSPIMRIPSRRVIAPALSSEKTRAAMAQPMREAVHAAWQGDESAAQTALEEAGQTGADAIRAFIDAGVALPNSPVTVSGGWIYNRVAKKGVPVSGKGFNKPLYDTGALYNAFGYEIEDE